MSFGRGGALAVLTLVALEYLAIWRGRTNSRSARGTWNDATDSGKLIAGYVVEYDPPP